VTAARQGVTADALLVADSWLLLDGRVRALDRHRARFAAACVEEGVPAAEVAAFWDGLVRELPDRGAWFPRAELRSGAPPALVLRPAPPRTTSVAVAVPPDPDPRAFPERKGPDLDVLMAWRHRYEPAGAGEVLLTTPDGLVAEAATSTLVWWEDDVLCWPAEDVRVLPSVTSSLVRDLAAADGVRCGRRRARLADLAGREVWLLNALHGLRPVTAWIGADVPVGAADRAARWQARLTELATPIG
jgi:branched-subunit amino acid aminotransferase/4-amino-4-deoxychorismate lyase